MGKDASRTLTLQLVVEVTRTDGKTPRFFGQSIAEQLFEFLDERCKDETFVVGKVDHAVSVVHLTLGAAPSAPPANQLIKE